MKRLFYALLILYMPFVLLATFTAEAAQLGTGMIVSGVLSPGSSDEKGYYMIGLTTADPQALVIMFNPKDNPRWAQQLDALLGGEVEITVRRK